MDRERGIEPPGKGMSRPPCQLAALLEDAMGKGVKQGSFGSDG